MKSIFAALSVVSLAVSAASAADLPARAYTKAPAVVAPVYDWTGFYLGANGGYGSSKNCWTGVAPSFGGLPESCKNATGGFAGGQIGYRWQVSNWVFGLEAQGDWADLHGQAVSAPATAAGDRTKIEAFGLFTAQIGYAWNNLLVYAKGGAAVTDNRFDHIDLIVTNLPYDSAKQTRWGGTVGAGIEYGFAPNWSIAFEYNHLFMGTDSVQFYAAGGANNLDRIKQDADLFAGKLNYHFNWGGPILAKY